MFKRNYISDTMIKKSETEYERYVRFAKLKNEDPTKIKSYDDWMKSNGWKWCKKWCSWYQ